jgi:hypothetical protein
LLFISLLDFNRIFGRFVTRGAQKHEFLFQKSPSDGAHPLSQKMFPPPPSVFFLPSIVLLDFFNRVSGRFVTRGVQKRDKKLAENFPQPPKKVVGYLRHFFFLHGAPCSNWLSFIAFSFSRHFSASGVPKHANNVKKKGPCRKCFTKK